MKTTRNLSFLNLTFGVCLLLFIGCKNKNETPPFPIAESEFEQPQTKKFEYSQKDTVQFISKTALNPLVTKKFNWDKMPSKPFDIGLPYSLEQNLPQQSFEWKNLPESNFNLDSLPKEDLIIEIKPLGKPRMYKTSQMLPATNGSRGVFSTDINLAFLRSARSIKKDENGMLWIGTDIGLAKYDSENVLFYSNEQGLTTGVVFDILIDSKGRFWLATNQGKITVIDFEAELIYELSSNFQPGIAYALMEAADGKIWVSNNGFGYNIIDPEEKTMYKLNIEQGLAGSFSITPFQDKEGLIWLTTNKGINIIDEKAGKIKTITKENGLISDFAYTFLQDNQDRIWVGSPGGASIFSSDKSKISYFTEKEGLISSTGVSFFLQDRQDRIWMGSENGLLFSYDEKSKMLEKFEINPASSQILYNITEDDQGQIWTAIVQGGLYKIDLNSGRPGNFTDDDGLGFTEVWKTLETKDGKIWIGTEGGIDVYDPEKQTIKSFNVENGLLSQRNTRLMEDSKGRIWSTGINAGVCIIDPVKETITHLTTEQGMPTNRIATAFEDKNGAIWLGGIDGELIKLENDHISLFNLSKDPQIKIWHNNILQDKNDELWIGTKGNGIFKVNLQDNSFVRLTVENGLTDDRVYSLAKDNRENMLTATQNGVEIIDLDKKEITTFTTDEGLAANDVYAIIAKGNQLFTGTSQGLTILTPQKSKESEKPMWQARSIGRTQGLNQIDFSENSFTIDRKGRFWAGVNGLQLTVIDEIKPNTIPQPTYISGINILDKKYDFKDYSKLEQARNALDTTWVSAKDTIFRKKAVQAEKNRFQYETVEGLYNMPVNLTLKPNDNFLSFSYNATTLNNSDQLVYRYFLEGIDKNWSTITDKTTSENYRDLPPGNYTFKAASRGFNGVWSKPAEFSFTITPPWWQTWWAYLGYLFILGLVVKQIHIYQKARTVRIEREKSREKELAQAKEIEKAYTELKATQSQLIQSEKMASLGELTAGIAHEIQNPLNFVNNFSEVSNELIDEMNVEIEKENLEDVKLIAKDIKQNLEKINHHGKRADAIVKGMLQHSRSSSGQKEPTDINALCDEYFRLAYHGLRAKDKSFNATMESDFESDLPKINVVPQDIGRVVLNLITNAFYVVDEKKKKGVKGYKPTVMVSTKKVGNTMKINIKDNGSGIPDSIKEKIFQPFFTTKPTNQGTGLGLSLSYDIVKTHGGELQVETKEGEGTTFIIILPM